MRRARMTAQNEDNIDRNNSHSGSNESYNATKSCPQEVGCAVFVSPWVKMKTLSAKVVGHFLPVIINVFPHS